jgi:Tfp pilus assembly protein PilN
MPTINLLPRELKPKEYVLKLSRLLKKIAMAGFATYLFVALLLVGAFLIISNRIKAVMVHQEDLKSQVKALQNTEQSLLLTQDRLAKINQIYGAANVSKQVQMVDEIVSRLPEGVAFDGASLRPEGNEITVTIGSSAYLTRFLELLKGSGYKRVELTSLILKGAGYEVKVSIAK